MGRRAVVITAGLAVVIAILLSVTLSPSTGLSFLAGSILGAASILAVTIRVRLMTAGRAQDNRAWRIVAALLAIPYYLALAVGLWAAATYYPQDAPWLLAGYILVLTAFAVTMWRPLRLKMPL
ncbi:MAG: hypothetical protein ACYC63_00825 [Armatimonadota bacterium]